MSYEAWGDGDVLARFVEQGGDTTTAISIRANWNPQWGKDPGRPDRIAGEAWDSVGDFSYIDETKK